MAMTQNGIIEDATGDLLKAGFTTGLGTVEAGQTQRTDVPHPGRYRGKAGATMMTRWDGTAWIEVAQPV